MTVVFYIAAAIAVLSTAMTITRLRAVHALLYLVISLLAVAVVFYTLGAPFVAALEVIIYAGAIMVLFIIVVMTLNIGDRAIETERSWMRAGSWIGPAALVAILLAEFIYVSIPGTGTASPVFIGPRSVSKVLFGPWLPGVELASMLLLAGIVGAYRLGQPERARTLPSGHIDREEEKVYAAESGESRITAGGDPVHAGAGRTRDAP